jgi:copper chaperone CopZ
MNFSKSLMALALSGILFTSCKQSASGPKTEAETSTEKPAATVAKLETATFTIEGMTCAIGCAKTIEKELSKLNGVQNAAVDFDKKLATITFDTAKQTPQSITKIVEATGDGKTYKVSNMKSAIYVADAKAANETKKACCSDKKQCKMDEKKS